MVRRLCWSLLGREVMMGAKLDRMRSVTSKATFLVHKHVFCLEGGETKRGTDFVTLNGNMELVISFLSHCIIFGYI